ncbi:conserved hypothetical protein [Solidesulfovibrio fructosivorans JJ]]|uniref:PBS lyase HEAT domain protein repeat-containing protein n=1 Tax=Solidesulfovibrio fructosivorans JJ] TaxID=596151 RepID=E1JT55_SOLFR|nr:HEAT repeat domain-containing protein [Solidesulfovibrio fructosivorans]EFL52315.1 conserved hypothetical protein [Solidesulfovibrio fructosivorans JJ]]
MPQFYCPHCWYGLLDGIAIYPSCGREIKQCCEGKAFVEKLIAALRHPEFTTPILAALLWGKLKDQRTVASLASLAATSEDVFIAQAAVHALGEIKTPKAMAFLHSIRDTRLQWSAPR